MNLIVQSVVFSKVLFPIFDAINWLKENGFSFLDIDEKKDTYRFRQIDPDVLKQLGYRFITKHAEPGVALIIAIKNETSKAFFLPPRVLLQRETQSLNVSKAHSL